MTEVSLFDNFDKTQHLLTQIDIYIFWPKSKIFDNFDPNRDFSKILTIFETFRQLSPKSIFSKILTQIDIFGKFWPKSRYLQIFTQIDIFRNFGQNQDFGKIVTHIEISEKVLKILRDKIQVFLRFWLKLTENPLTSNAIENIQFSSNTNRLAFPQYGRKLNPSLPRINLDAYTISFCPQHVVYEEL